MGNGLLVQHRCTTDVAQLWPIDTPLQPWSTDSLSRGLACFSPWQMAVDCPAGACPLYSTALVLFRKDLRVYDNPALLAASQAASVVVPVFVWAPEEEGQFQPGRCSKWWLKQTLKDLAQQLETLGSCLIIRQAHDSTEMLLQLAQETSAQAVFFNHLFDPISLVRDHAMKQRLTAAGYTCRSYNADLLYEPWEVLDDSGQPLHTFQGFWHKLQAMPNQPPVPFPAPQALPAVSPELTNVSLDDLGFFSTIEQEETSNQLGTKWQPGTAGGVARLEHFLTHQLPNFSHLKGNVDLGMTSKLSPWIHVGSVSVRHIYHKVKVTQSGWLVSGNDDTSCCQDFIQQLAYREYSRYLSFHFPFLHERPLLSHLRCVPWNLDQHAFKAWKMGLTGVPLVDAAMKELWSSGWMHNRLRVVCGVFAVKHLLIPWQWGLKHFWDALLDADLESDALGWQYVAGCMVDAPPFGEVMDVTAEATAFDPNGEFVRRWLPVLARLPTTYVHAPWTAPQSVLDAADVELGFNYPYPIVTHEVAAARVAEVAAIIDENLQLDQQQQQQQNVGASGLPNNQPQAEAGAAVRQPYRPATRPVRSNSHRGTGSGAAAAAAADMQKSNSILSQRHPPGAAAARGSGGVAAQMLLQPRADHPACAAAADGGGGIEMQGNYEWQQLAVEGDIHLRNRQQQRQRQLQQQQQQRRRNGQQRQQQRPWQANVAYDDDDNDGYESEGSVESEVFSSAPCASEAQPTACSGVAQQSQRQQQQQQQREPQDLDEQSKVPYGAEPMSARKGLLHEQQTANHHQQRQQRHSLQQQQQQPDADQQVEAQQVLLEQQQQRRLHVPRQHQLPDQQQQPQQVRQQQEFSVGQELSMEFRRQGTEQQQQQQCVD